MVSRITFHSLLTLLFLTIIITPILSTRFVQSTLPLAFKQRFTMTKEVLGMGSFGVVYRATETLTNNSVAIKIGRLQPHQQETEEIRILHKLKENNVTTVSLIDTTVFNDAFIIATNLISRVDGDQLFMDYVQNNKLSALEALTHLQTLVSTMAQVHALNIVHNDIKVDVSLI